MASHPTLVVVPGSFSRSSDYDSIANPLREKGYTVHVLDAPCYPNSYKKGTPAPNMHDDAKFIHDFVEKIVDEGKEVVMWAHSYGGESTVLSLPICIFSIVWNWSEWICSIDFGSKYKLDITTDIAYQARQHQRV